MRTRGLGLAAIIGLTACAVAAHAGGFWLSVKQADSRDPKMKNAVLLFQVDGCHGPGATVAGTAEGIVGGKRKSIPLKLKKIADQTFTLTRQWPREGRWALAMTATAPADKANGSTWIPKSHAVVELSDSGAILINAPAQKGGRSSIKVLRPDKETLAQLVEKTLKSYSARQAAL
jgi:hypothetical protein